MDTEVSTYETVAQPTLPLETGEDLVKDVLGRHVDILFGDDVTLVELENADYPESKNDKHGFMTVFSGSLSNGNDFMLQTSLQGNKHELQMAYIAYPGGAVRTYDNQTGQTMTYLADTSKPDGASTILEEFKADLAKKPPPVFTRKYKS